MDERQRRKRQKERERQVRRRKRQIAGSGLVLLLILILVFTVRGRTRRQQGDSVYKEDTYSAAEAAVSVSEASADSVEQQETQEAVTLKLSFVGDCTLGTDENFDWDTGFNAYYENYGADYFLKNVRSIFEADDATIVNMEGTFTNSDEREDKTYAFKADPAYVSVLTGSSVEAANLANNHSHDYGNDSYEDTKNTLENAGIRYFGNGNLAILDLQGVKVGLSGVYELAELTGCEDQMAEDIAALKEQGAQIIAVEFHWGIEKEEVPDENQVYLAHAAIQAGADLVVGAHPHVLQGIEIYQNKPIVYSMGNFCFGGNSNPSDKDTMIYQQEYVLQNGEITDSRMNIIPCSLSSESDYNDYCPTPLTGEESERVLKKIQYRSDLISETYGSSAADILDTE